MGAFYLSVLPLPFKFQAKCLSAFTSEKEGTDRLLYILLPPNIFLKTGGKLQTFQLELKKLDIELKRGWG